METIKRFIEVNNAPDISDINIFKINKSFSRDFSMIPTEELITPDFEICLPFRRCFVDFKKSYLLQQGFVSITADSLVATEIAPNHIATMCCIRVYEGSSEKYYYINTDYIDNQPKIDKLLPFIKTNTTESMINIICNLITKVLEELCSRKYVYVENNEKIDVKFRNKATRKLNRVKYTPKMIIYISDKKAFKNEHPELSGRIISKPQHAFECSGHYRKLHNEDWFGHDRQGNLVQGWTWVNPFVKNKEAGEVLKKIRVIK